MGEATIPRSTLSLALSNKADTEFESLLHQEIREFNNVHSEHHRLARQGGITPLNIVVRDADRSIVGGLAATIYWQWHLNPVEAGLVKAPTDWQFSSYQDYIGLRTGTLPQPDIVLNRFPNRQSYQKFVEAEPTSRNPQFDRWLKRYSDEE